MSLPFPKHGKSSKSGLSAAGSVMALVNQVFRCLSCFCWSSLVCCVIWEGSSSLGGVDISFFFFKMGPFLFIYLFISGCAGSSLLRRLSLVAEKGGCS